MPHIQKEVKSSPILKYCMYNIQNIINMINYLSVYQYFWVCEKGTESKITGLDIKDLRKKI
jgi:hypothetical protein